MSSKVSVMDCLLCGVNKATKSNTHYLTDAIIRTALNVGGANSRGTGLYWKFSTEEAGLKFGFQQATFDLKLEATLGRPPTDEEIDEARRKTAFSVDNHFCPSCEELFTTIETLFIDQILPLFRESDLTGKSEVNTESVRIVRAFFLTQVLRSALCDEIFTLTEEVLKDLKDIVLNSQTIDLSRVTKYPLSVTYLQTIGGPAAYTENQVGYAVNEESQIILMNDFVIQFFVSQQDVKCVDFNGLNDTSDFEKYMNVDERVFEFKILNNDQRLAFLNPGWEAFSDRLIAYFQAKHMGRFNQFASPKMVAYFMTSLADESADIPDGVRYGEERLEVIANTILDRIALETARHRHWHR